MKQEMADKTIINACNTTMELCHTCHACI